MVTGGPASNKEKPGTLARFAIDCKTLTYHRVILGGYGYSIPLHD